MAFSGQGKVVLSNWFSFLRLGSIHSVVHILSHGIKFEEERIEACFLLEEKSLQA